MPYLIKVTPQLIQILTIICCLPGIWSIGYYESPHSYFDNIITPNYIFIINKILCYELEEKPPETVYINLFQIPVDNFFHMHFYAK